MPFLLAFGVQTPNGFYGLRFDIGNVVKANGDPEGHRSKLKCLGCGKISAASEHQSVEPNMALAVHLEAACADVAIPKMPTALEKSSTQASSKPSVSHYVAVCCCSHSLETFIFLTWPSDSTTSEMICSFFIHSFLICQDHYRGGNARFSCEPLCQEQLCQIVPQHLIEVKAPEINGRR